MSLINNPKKSVIAVAIFITLFLAALATKCHASGEPSYMTVRGGTTVLRGPAPALELTLSTPVAYSEDNPYAGDGRLEYGLLLIGSSTYEKCGAPTLDGCKAPVGPQQNQIALSAKYVDGFGPVDLGLGLVALQHSDAYNSGAINFMLMAGYHSRQFSIRYEHISNAGTNWPNLGRDMIMIGWSFKPQANWGE